MVNKFFAQLINIGEKKSLNKNCSLKHPKQREKKSSNHKFKFNYSNKSGYFEDDKVIVLIDSKLKPSETLGANYQNFSDAENIGNYYQEHELKLLDKVQGSFSFIIWDKIQCILIGARDHIGIKNIFYSLSGNGNLIISNDIKQILSNDLVSKELDENAIYNYLYLKAFESPDTPLKSIKSLRAGHKFILKANDLKVKEYWKIKYNKIKNINEHDATSKINELLTQDIKTLGSKDKVAVMLSGGLDSSYLTALATDNLTKKINTYTVTFGKEGKKNDERNYSKLVASKFSTHHEEIRIDEDKILENLSQLIENLYTPVANSGYKLVNVLNSKYIDDIRYIIIGEGADTLFGLDGKWRKFEILEKYLYPLRIIPRKTREQIYKISSNIFNKLLKFNSNIFIRGFNRYFTLKNGKFKWKGSTIQEKRLKKIFINNNSLTSVGNKYRSYINNIGIKSFSDKYSVIALKTYTPNQQLAHYTSLCETKGIEVIYPFLNKELIEYCINLPYVLKTKSNIKKYLLYKIAKSILPKKIINRKKAVFKMPFDQWLRGKLKPLTDYTFSRATVEKRGIFKYNEMQKIYQDYYFKNTINWVDIWSFVILELWFIVHLDKNKIEDLEDLIQL